MIATQSSTAIKRAVPDKRRWSDVRLHLAYGILLVCITAFTWKLLQSLLELSMYDQSSSHLLLIPFVSIFLVVVDRDRIFAETRPLIGAGALCVAAGSLAYWWLARQTLVAGTWSLSGASLAEIVIWVGGFIFCYGSKAARSAAFPLLFLLLMIPLPAPILTRVVHFLQQGSTDMAYMLFKLVGTPVLRQGFVLALPGVTIRVAEECSSIRSSIALVITCLLAGHFWLRRARHVLLLLLAAAVFSVVKNGIRIAALVLLSIYVDPRFLTGSLHRDGGFVFFFLALAMVWPVLSFLQRREACDPQLVRER